MKNKQSNKYGFTLVELLAVIVILGLILVIVVPKITKTINNSKMRTLELTARSIAKSAEEKYVENETFGTEEEILCEGISGISDNDYSWCNISFDENGIAKVTINGDGRYKGLNVCDGTKTEAIATSESCTSAVNATNFVDDDWSTIVAVVKSENHPYQVGDTKTVDMGDLGTHTLRVANTTKCSELEIEPLSKTACGFVLEFVDIITTREMNGDSINYTGKTNIGGWPASEMRSYVNSDIYNALPKDLRNGIINTYVVSSHGSGDKGTIGDNKNFASTDKLYLLSSEEVWAQQSGNIINIDTSKGTSRQLDYYASYEGEEYIGVSLDNYAGAIKNNSSGSPCQWWLRSAQSEYTDFFSNVGSDGDWYYNYSYGNFGVSPAFRLLD